MPRLPHTSPKEEKVLIPQAKALIIVGSKGEVQSTYTLGNIQGLHVKGVEIPGGVESLAKKLNPLYLNRTVTNKTLVEIQDTIRDQYLSHNRPFVIVQVPSQDVTSGILQIIVMESQLGKVEVQGNTWFSTKRLAGYLDVDPGQFINQQSVLNDLDFINRNPFRRVDVIYAPGEKPGTTDVILHVEDRMPYRLYAGAENTGVPTTNRQRYFAGFNWGNAFGLDHIFAYQFTASYNIDRFQSHTAQYIAPLPWRHVLDVYGGVSWVEPKLDFPSMRSQGFSSQVSARYIIPFMLGIYLRQELVIGFDWKRTNNTIEFTDEFPSFGKNVNLTQFVLEYGNAYERNHYRIDFTGTLYYSPGKWISDQEDSNFSSLRPGAKNHWVYFLGSLSYLQRLPKSFSFYFLSQGQLSSQNLLPSEQFGLGGYDTVRGYDQREVSAENGILLSGELRSPALPVLHYFKAIKKVDAIQFLVFLDYGWARYKKTIPFESKSQYLLGVGPGLRYTLEPYLTARLDWGIKLHKQARYGGGDTMVHFSVTGSF
ncbi:MAG: ShlB/FhaC/HecB family hemolysin secretion/activation protein [Simkaniaceae bacterium]